MEDILKEELKSEFKLKMLDRVTDVNYELKKELSSENKVLESCPEYFIKIANKALEIEKKQGYFRINDFTDREIFHIKEYAKENNIPMSYVFNTFLSNPNFISRHVVESRKLVNLLNEFDKGILLSYPKYHHFPLNLLSPETRRYLSDTQRGLEISDKLRAVLEVFRPEFKNIEIVLYNHELLAQSRLVLTQEEIKKINLSLEKYAKNKNIDSIFLQENEKEFKELNSFLINRAISFEDYIKNYTNFTYSKCYKIDILTGIKHMVNDYRLKHQTTIGITQNDPYLRSKIEAAQHVLHIPTIKALFDELKIENDNEEIYKDVLTYQTIMDRESILVEDLNELYKDGIIAKDFTKKHSRLYEEVKFLADKNNYDDINDYLSDLGFQRECKNQPLEERIFYLSEQDLYYYNFISKDYDENKIAEKFIENKIVKLDPSKYLKVYRKLVANRLDTRASKTEDEIKPYIR